MSPLELLLRVQSRDSTGQLFVVTYDGRQIRIGIETGRIVHVGYGPRRGKTAAELASNAVAKSATFRADPDVMRDEDLPNERFLLGMLSRMLSGSNAEAVSSVLSVDAFDPETIQSDTGGGLLDSDISKGPRTKAAGLETRNIKRVASSPIPAAQLSRLKAILVDYVGPMAGLLVDEKLAGELRTSMHWWSVWRPRSATPRTRKGFARQSSKSSSDGAQAGDCHPSVQHCVAGRA